MRIGLRLCLHLLFALFAVFLASRKSPATQTAALRTKSALPAAFSLATTTTTEASASTFGDEIGLSVECHGPVKGSRVHPAGIPKPNFGIVPEFGSFHAARGCEFWGSSRAQPSKRRLRDRRSSRCEHTACAWRGACEAGEARPLLLPSSHFRRNLNSPTATSRSRAVRWA